MICIPLLCFAGHLILIATQVGPSLSDDPLGSPEAYLKYDVKKGASLDPDYEAVSTSNGLENPAKRDKPQT